MVIPYDQYQRNVTGTQVLHFLILVFILNRIMFRPLMKLIGERSDHFQKLRAEIDLLEQETARLQGEIEGQEKAARKDASRARTRLRNSAMQEVEKLFGREP